jgi:hypothetical protein
VQAVDDLVDGPNRRRRQAVFVTLGLAVLGFFGVFAFLST